MITTKSQNELAVLSTHTRIVLSRLCFLGMPIHAALIFIFEWLGLQEMMLFNIGSTIAWVTAYMMLRHGTVKPASAILVTEIVLHATFAVHFMGWESGFQYYLVPTIILVIFLDVIPEWLSLFLAALIAGIYLLLLLTGGSYAIAIEEQILLSMKYTNLALSLVALILIGYFYRKSTLVSESRLGEMARTDPLTGLLNRRGAYEILQEHVKLCNARNGSVSIAITDVDGFKAINDRYGHSCGDRILREIGSLLREGLRSTDMVARWGGEEFLILLPGSNASEASDICEKLRSRIESHHVNCSNQRVSFTITIGIADYHSGDEMGSVISNADKVLYAGKEAGRNRVEVWKSGT